MNSEVQAYRAPVIGPLSIYEPGVMETAFKIGELLADSMGMVPVALIGKKGACTAIAMQARIWNMSPFNLAAMAYQTPEGRVSYEAKAIMSAAYSMGAIVEPLAFEPVGDWSRIAGKTKEKTGKNDKTYITKDWTLADEEGLGVKVVGIMPGGVIREREILLSSIGTRFSTLWASDPFQQLCYYAGRAWVRLNAPHVLAGVPENDRQSEVDMGAAQVVRDNPHMSPAERVAARLEPVRQKVMGEAPPPTLVDVLDFIAKAHTPADMERAAKMVMELPANTPERERGRAAYKDHMAALKGKAVEDVQHTDTPAPAAADKAPPTFTKADILNALRNSESTEALDAAADLIKHLVDEQDREDCLQEYRDLKGTEA